MKSISIKSPATIANLVCGFDILGLALEEPYDIMTLENTDHAGLEIVHVDDHGLPTEPEQNVSGAALLAMMEELSEVPNWKLTIDKRIKPGSGLGSSAASAAGAVFAADKETGIAIARRIRTGQVTVNGGGFNPNAPFGGYKQSGIGRELGEHGFEEFLEIKSLQL